MKVYKHKRTTDALEIARPLLERFQLIDPAMATIEELRNEEERARVLSQALGTFLVELDAYQEYVRNRRDELRFLE